MICIHTVHSLDSKIHGCKIQDTRGNDEEETDKHLEARDRRYSCSIFEAILQTQYF